MTSNTTENQDEIRKVLDDLSDNHTLLNLHWNDDAFHQHL
jgi:hypothetical protein